jgi:NRAMP (natural resistance-associated macrophage protein)-like metal ion transporter
MTELTRVARGDPPPDEIKLPDKPKLLQIMGPGLITGASDDDPSGIATYSQAGAQFGYDMGWTLLVSWPLMCAIQEISARIGRVTGHGIAGNLRRHYPAALVYSMVALLAVANTINLGADLGAMGAALKLVLGDGNAAKGGPALLYVAGFAVAFVVAEIFVRYSRYVSVLKWLTLSLFAYVAVAFIVKVPWGEVGYHLVVPNISFTPGYFTVVVAILGTTISPYLFFWQAEEEVDEVKERPDAQPLNQAPEQAPQELGRIRIDTYLGMAFSNIVAVFIMITTAAMLHAHGVTDIQTSSQAALALRPIAGQFAFLIFALGIIGCGLLALPVLAASAAYAIGEAFGWRVGLSRRFRRAKAFYGAIIAAGLVGGALNFVHIDPIKALFWSAVINGVAAVPIMAMIMHLASHRPAMGDFKIHWGLKTVGWVATAVMAVAAVGMFATMGA